MNNLRKRFKTPMVMVVIIAAVVFVTVLSPVIGASLQSSKSTNDSVNAVKKHIVTPNQARDFLSDLDMPTRNYEKTGEAGLYGAYSARSDYMVLETRDSNRYINNLTYYVSGDKFLAKVVELELTVNDLSFSSNAIAEFIKYSDGLMHKVTGKKLPPEIKKAIQSKTNGTWVVYGYKIRLVKETFPDEKIAKGEESTSDHGAFSLMFLIEL